MFYCCRMMMKFILTLLSILVVSLIMLTSVEAACHPGIGTGDCAVGEVWIFLFFNRAAFHICVYNYILIWFFESPTYLNSKVLWQYSLLASLNILRKITPQRYRTGVCQIKYSNMTNNFGIPIRKRTIIKLQKKYIVEIFNHL